MSEYVVVSTGPSTYHDKDKGIVNGILIRFRIVQYDEVHEVRIPKMDTQLAKVAIEAVVTERDNLAKMSSK